jgi:hypothetical protein
MKIWKPKSIVKDITHVVEMKKTFVDLVASMFVVLQMFFLLACVFPMF